jgi:hypothetical protein
MTLKAAFVANMRPRLLCWAVSFTRLFTRAFILQHEELALEDY